MLDRARASVVLVLFCLASVSDAKLDAGDQCVVDKLKLGARFLTCRLKLEAVAVKANRVPDFTPCDEKFDAKFARIETTAAGACPVTGNAAALRALMAAHTQAVTTAITTCGVQLGGACWYLGTAGQSCDDVCSGAARAYDPATGTYAGAEGTSEHCAAVLSAFDLGPLDTPDAPCAVGLACAIGNDGVSFRCGLGTTASSAAVSTTRRLCACL